MPATFVVVPQWQGSGSSRAMRLVDGAEAIRGDLPVGATRVVEVPLGAGDGMESGVARMSSLTLVADRLRAVLGDIDGTAIVIGGDCGIEYTAIEHALDEATVLLWFDAHADLNTVEESPSTAFCGMVVRALLGEGPASMSPTVPLESRRLVYAGTRSLDDAEVACIRERDIRLLGVDALEEPGALVAALRATGATSVYIHIDLDVLDPADFMGLTQPVPFGLRADALVALVREVRAALPLAGAGITQFAPSSPGAAIDDLPTILRLIGALSA